MDLIVYESDELGRTSIATIERRATADEWEANARLIRAAPELLRELASLLEELDGAKELILSQCESDSWMVTEDGWDALIGPRRKLIESIENPA